MLQEQHKTFIDSYASKKMILNSSSLFYILLFFEYPFLPGLFCTFFLLFFDFNILGRFEKDFDIYYLTIIFLEIFTKNCDKFKGYD